MLRYMLDTSLCIRVLRDRPPHIRERFNAEAASLSISSVVYYELMFGAKNSVKPASSSRAVEDFVARLEVLDFDAEAADHSADIRAVLSQKAHLIGPYDLMIAGHARSRGLCVVTGNLREFIRVDGLRAEDWL